MYRQSLDNVTVVMVAFSSFKRIVFGKSKHSERSEDLNQMKENAPPNVGKRIMSAKNSDGRKIAQDYA